MEKLLTAKEVADHLRVPIGTVYRWNYIGTGPRAITVGRHVVYRESDVDAWLEERAQETSRAKS